MVTTSRSRDTRDISDHVLTCSRAHERTVVFTKPRQTIYHPSQLSSARDLPRPIVVPWTSYPYVSVLYLYLTHPITLDHIVALCHLDREFNSSCQSHCIASNVPKKS